MASRKNPPENSLYHTWEWWTREKIYSYLERNIQKMNRFPIKSVFCIYTLDELRDGMLLPQKLKTYKDRTYYYMSHHQVMVFMRKNMPEIKARINELYEYAKQQPWWDHDYDGRAVMERTGPVRTDTPTPGKKEEHITEGEMDKPNEKKDKQKISGRGYQDQQKIL